jgi:predicted secreted protein
MSGEMNGSDVLVQINQGTDVSPIWITVASQKGVVITESVATIDTSSKEKSEETHLPGRYSATLTLDTLYVEGAASFRELQYRLRNGVQVRLRTSTLGVNDEVALATVTGITKTAADQQAVTANASFKLSGPWEAAE